MTTRSTLFGVHGAGGTVGALLTGVTAGSLGGSGLPDGVSIAGQVWIQAKGVLFTAAWSGIGSFAILKALDAAIGVRVTREQEVEGLDLALHDERASGRLTPILADTPAGPRLQCDGRQGFSGAGTPHCAA